MIAPVEHVTVITPRFPLPVTSGTQLREYHSLQRLVERFDVTLVSLVQDGEGREHVDELEALGIEVRTVPHNRSKREAAIRTVFGTPYRVAKFGTPAFRDAIGSTLDDRTTDLVWVHFLSTIPLLPSDLDVPVVLDEHNADIRYWQSFADGPLVDSGFAWLNRLLIRRLQRQVSNRIDVVISVSEEDAAVTRQWIDAPVVVAPNGADPGRFSSKKKASEVDDHVVFVGSLDVRMNEEAIVWFVETVWRDVRQDRPDAHLSIVGKTPSERVRSLGDTEGVTVVGEVPDVVGYYERAAVVIAPFRYGGGSKLKLLEALSMERPLVTTETGATGIELHDGGHALIRERNSSFADAVVELLADPTRREQLGRQGRSFVCERYTWEQNMQNAINSVLEIVDMEDP